MTDATEELREMTGLCANRGKKWHPKADDTHW